ncbi:MAG: hypothetical protein AAAFM81_10070 [Pseudomonadota bacterium]
MISTRDQVKERREEMLQQVEEKAERDFSDTRYNFVRSQVRRRWLVVLSYVLLTGYGLSSVFDFPGAALALLIVWGASVWLLRTAIRGLTDYPDELVDERIREVRGQTYRLAFLGANCLFSLYLVIYIVNQLLAKPGIFLPMSADTLHELAFPFFFGMMVLPTAIFAWRERWV